MQENHHQLRFPALSKLAHHHLWAHVELLNLAFTQTFMKSDYKGVSLHNQGIQQSNSHVNLLTIMIGILLMCFQQENVFHHNTFFMAIYTASLQRTPTKNHPRDTSKGQSLGLWALVMQWILAEHMESDNPLQCYCNVKQLMHIKMLGVQIQQHQQL